MGKDWDAPWQSGINADAGFASTGFTDGAQRLPRPTFTGSTNPHCRNCGGRQRGRRDGTAIWKTCICDHPQFPNVRAVEMRAYQEWCEAWARECLRVLKPGGWMLAFGGTRTWHRLTCAIEDAGFEVRDSVADLTGIDGPGLLWLYSQGFPKSLDVSKAIDRQRDDSEARRAVGRWLREQREQCGLSAKDVAEHFRTAPERVNHGGCVANWEGGLGCPTWEQWSRLREVIGFGDEMDADVWRLNGRKGLPGDAWVGREVVGQRTTGIGTGNGTVPVIGDSENRDITAAATDAAKQWEGWGTALKPSWEPIVVARKPLAGTVAQNVLRHGTGALNIFGCLVPHAGSADLEALKAKNPGRGDLFTSDTYGADRPQQSVNDAGRWPPNVALGSMAADELDRQADAASRIFPVFRYEPKAPKSERPRLPDGTAHPTVKPLDLIRWLVRLITPPGGTVADFFAGSGTTGEACIIEGFSCILIEQDPASAELIKTRLSKPIQPVMFGLDAS